LGIHRHIVQQDFKASSSLFNPSQIYQHWNSMARQISLGQHLRGRKSFRQGSQPPFLFMNLEDQRLWHVEKSTNGLTGDIQQLQILICPINQAL